MHGTIAKLSWKHRWLLAGCVGLSVPFLLSNLLIQRIRLTHCECDYLKPPLHFSIFDAHESVAWFIKMTLGPSPGMQAFVVLLLCLTTVLAVQRLRYKAAIKRLAAAVEKSAILPAQRAQYLLACLNTNSTPIRQSASTELATVLPSLSPNDFEHFDSTTRKSLHRLLNHLDYAVVLGALHALSNVGSRRDMRAVRNLLHSEPLSASDLQVRRAARECLSQIQKRANNRSNKRVLLRTTESDPATLMRTLS